MFILKFGDLGVGMGMEIFKGGEEMSGGRERGSDGVLWVIWVWCVGVDQSGDGGFETSNANEGQGVYWRTKIICPRKEKLKKIQYYKSFDNNNDNNKIPEISKIVNKK